LKRGIDIAKQAIKEFLDEIVIECNTKEFFYKVAMVSSNYDENISEIVSEAVYSVGK